MKIQLVSCPTCGCICKVIGLELIPFLKIKKKIDKHIKDIEKVHKITRKSKLNFMELDGDKKLKKFYENAKFFDLEGK